MVIGNTVKFANDDRVIVDLIIISWMCMNHVKIAIQLFVPATSGSSNVEFRVQLYCSRACVFCGTSYCNSIDILSKSLFCCCCRCSSRSLRRTVQSFRVICVSVWERVRAHPSVTVQPNRAAHRSTSARFSAVNNGEKNRSTNAIVIRRDARLS